MKSILYLCTGNSARSIMAECYTNHVYGKTGWRAYSAGSKPTGAPNPFALQTLKNHNINTEGVSSKSWDVFATHDAPIMDVIVTVCDNAAGEVCPVWPTPEHHEIERQHWGFPDPAATHGPQEVIAADFETVFQKISMQIDRYIKSL